MLDTRNRENSLMPSQMYTRLLIAPNRMGIRAIVEGS